MTLEGPFLTESAPPEGKPSSAAQTNLPPALTEWHMHGPELEGEDGQSGMMREGAVDQGGGCDYRRKRGRIREVEEQKRYLAEDIKLSVHQ